MLGVAAGLWQPVRRPGALQQRCKVSSWDSAVRGRADRRQRATACPQGGMVAAGSMHPGRASTEPSPLVGAAGSGAWRSSDPPPSSRFPPGRAPGPGANPRQQVALHARLRPQGATRGLVHFGLAPRRALWLRVMAQVAAFAPLPAARIRCLSSTQNVTPEATLTAAVSGGCALRSQWNDHRQHRLD